MCRQVDGVCALWKIVKAGPASRLQPFLAHGFVFLGAESSSR
jgi:hypothetical protein